MRSDCKATESGCKAKEIFKRLQSDLEAIWKRSQSDSEAIAIQLQTIGNQS
jgi:hypothetical protein